MTVTEESFASLASYWTEAKYNLRWSPIFVLPGWLQVWWQTFGADAELYLRAVREGEEIIGIAPLLIRGKTASIIGSADVCDYLDFIVTPGAERDFFNVLLDDLTRKGISHLDLKPLRPDSTVLTDLVAVARNRGHPVQCQREGVSVELDLPPTWEEYLASLTRKHRYEVKRKLRRLEAAGKADYRCIAVSPGEGDFMDTFLRLFSLSRGEKASFMTAQMESFFRSLAETMAEIGLLRFGILELDGVPVAMTMGFDYNGSVYLYNSAYDPEYGYLSVGLLSKVLCIKDSIRNGRRKWDFLRGGEPYKYHIGGREVPLYSCQIKIS